jgi:hypothetical protein
MADQGPRVLPPLLNLLGHLYPVGMSASPERDAPSTDKQMYGCMDAWMHGCMDARMYGCMDE